MSLGNVVVGFTDSSTHREGRRKPPWLSSSCCWLRMKPSQWLSSSSLLLLTRPSRAGGLWVGGKREHKEGEMGTHLYLKTLAWWTS